MSIDRSSRARLRNRMLPVSAFRWRIPGSVRATMHIVNCHLLDLSAQPQFHCLIEIIENGPIDLQHWLICRPISTVSSVWAAPAQNISKCFCFRLIIFGWLAQLDTWLIDSFDSLDPLYSNDCNRFHRMWNAGVGSCAVWPPDECPPLIYTRASVIIIWFICFCLLVGWRIGRVAGIRRSSTPPHPHFPSPPPRGINRLSPLSGAQ